jgi:acyl carrier protein
MSITTRDIERDVRTFLIDTFLFGRAEELGNGESLQGNVFDSTGVLELVAFLQDHFEIAVDDDEVNPENLGSVRSIVVYVTRKLGNPA